MKRKILFVTGSRAEYGLLRKSILASAIDNDIEMSLIVTGSHLSTKHGLTYKDIEKDKIKPTQKININLHGDSPKDVINSMCIAMKRFSNAFLKLKPDLIVLLGDRYEIFFSISTPTTWQSNSLRYHTFLVGGIFACFSLVLLPFV